MIHLSTELHLKPAAIAKRLDVHRHPVENTLKRYQETGAVKDRQRPGRKRKISGKDEKKVIKKAKKEKDAREIARDYERETKIKVSDATIRRIINEQKLAWLTREPVEALTPANEAKRLAYAPEMRNHNWKRVLFSDEKVFYLGRRRLTPTKSQESEKSVL